MKGLVLSEGEGKFRLVLAFHEELRYYLRLYREPFKAQEPLSQAGWTKTSTVRLFHHLLLLLSIGAQLSQSQKEKEKILLTQYLTGLKFNLQHGLFKRMFLYRVSHTLYIVNPSPQICTMITLTAFQAREQLEQHHIMFN